jgi:hypothetical protein
VKGGAKVQRLAGRRKTVTLPWYFCENAWFFTAADAVKANEFSAERKTAGSYLLHFCINTQRLSA